MNAPLPLPTDASRSNTKRRMTGGQAMAEMLKLANVGPIFGMGGFQLLPFYEACRTLSLAHVLINDERAGAFAADAYARVTNRPGTCDGTLGPGATNLVTGLVESCNAGVPQIVFAGDTNRAHSWKNMTQEARQVDILRPAVKDVLRIEMPERIPELLRRAFAVATAGRGGPVVLDVPEDVAHAEIEFDAGEFWIDEATTRLPARRFRPDPSDVERAAALLARARRPLLLVGGGIHLSAAYDALATLAAAQSIPVCHTISGKGAIACTDPLSAGLFGRYSRIANDMVGETDLLIVVGCKLGEIATKRFQLMPPGVALVHIDIVPEELGRTTRPDIAMVGDARLALADLAAAASRPKAPDARRDWAASVSARMRAWRDGAADKLESAERPINVGRVLSEINRVLPADGIMVADGGFAGHWSGLLFDTKTAGRHFIADRGFASIGYGVPGSLGAQLAARGRRVIGLTGDGGFNMSLGDLETALRAKAPFVLCVVNNAASGYVKALQHAVYGPGRYQSSDLVEMDYAAIARNFRCHGLRADDPAALADALREGLANTDTPTVIDVIVTRDPARMLPGVDNRTLKIEKGDRPV